MKGYKALRLARGETGRLVMANTTKTDRDTDLDTVLLEAREELETLRYEIERYKLVFDSARLLIGHEFIRPLTAISGYIELLESDLGEEVAAKNGRYVQKAKDAVGRLEELIDATVQMFSTENKVERVYAWERVDLPLLVEKVKSRFGKNSARIRSTVPASLCNVALRRRGLEIVVENLVSNALKHSEAPSEIIVSASLIKNRRGGSDGELMLMSVQDRGKGIPEDELKRVFDPFYRGSCTGRKQGLGLGLALVKSIVTIMNGEIHIKSCVGEGTTVTFTVPVGEGVDGRPEIVG